MRAAIIHGKRDIRVENVPNPEIESNSIVIKVKTCGICGSDLHTYKLGRRQGVIIGHEFSGDVEEVGSSVTDIKKGERVVAVSYRPCGQCYQCKQGMFHRCSNIALAGGKIPGALADYISVPFAQLNRNVFRLSDNISYEEGSTVEPISVALYAIKRAQPKPEDTVVVLGTGIIGLGAIQILKAMGVAKVIASGRRSKRIELAKMSGADVVIDAAKEDALLAVKEATSGLGADIVLEFAGSPASFDQAIKMVHGGGKVMLVAMYESPITWDPAAIIDKNITLVGCMGAASFPTVLQLMETKKVNSKPLITHRFPLSQVREAFETEIEAQDAIKVIVEM